MIKYTLIILLSATVFSCGEKSEKLEVASDNIQVSFVKLDSVQIDYVGNLIVHDLIPASRTVLFEERGEYAQEIILADFDGNIISSFSKFGDMPDTYGILLSSMRLLDGNSFLAYGSNGFLTYDFKGNMLSRVKLVDFEPPNYNPIFMGQGMEKLREEYIYVNHNFP